VPDTRLSSSSLAEPTGGSGYRSRSRYGKATLLCGPLRRSYNLASMPWYATAPHRAARHTHIRHHRGIDLYPCTTALTKNNRLDSDYGSWFYVLAWHLASLHCHGCSAFNKCSFDSSHTGDTRHSAASYRHLCIARCASHRGTRTRHTLVILVTVLPPAATSASPGVLATGAPALVTHW